MTTNETPTPAQQLEEVLTLRAAAEQARARNESATADHLEEDADEIILDLGRKHAPTLRRALAALEAVECDCATKVNQVCDKCCAKTEAVWLMPVATMEPQNGKLLQYAHGRSHLSTGQMAHAYQCIVEAAKECGQIIPADAVEVSRG